MKLPVDDVASCDDFLHCLQDGVTVHAQPSARAHHAQLAPRNGPQFLRGVARRALTAFGTDYSRRTSAENDHQRVESTRQAARTVSVKRERAVDGPEWKTFDV